MVGLGLFFLDRDLCTTLAARGSASRESRCRANPRILTWNRERKRESARPRLEARSRL